MLVYLDHFVYAYFLRPHEQSSKEAVEMVGRGEIRTATNFLIKSHTANGALIFHNARFQVLFLLFAVFVITSSNSLLGTGTVLGFLLHLLVDMARDLTETKSLDKWFAQLSFGVDSQQQRWYFLAQIVTLLVLGLFL